MSLKVISLAIAIATSTAVSIFGSAAKAQTAADVKFQPSPTLADRFEEAFYSHDKNYFENRSFFRQLDTIVGWGSFKTSFVENEINADTEAVHNLYVDAFARQVSSDPVIRTRDLPNPYDSSILQSNSDRALIQRLQN